MTWTMADIERKGLTYIVSVSGGAGSTLAAHRAVEKHGADNVILLFADTRSEDPSLYKILDHMDKILKPVIRLSDGRDIWDVFDDEGIIRTPKNGACKASIELKRKPLDRWIAGHYSHEEAVCVTGLGYDEPERIMRFDKEHAPYRTWHPLTEPPILSHCQIVEAVRELGYPDQTLYDNGYPHNNCGGACVLAGLSQWRGLWLDFPERFEYAKQREKQFNEKHRAGKEPYTVLRDQSAKPVVTKEIDGCDLFGETYEVRMEKKTTSISLEEFERRLTENTIDVTRDFRSGCGCMLRDDDPELI